MARTRGSDSVSVAYSSLALLLLMLVFIGYVTVAEKEAENAALKARIVELEKDNKVLKSTLDNWRKIADGLVELDALKNKP